MLLYYSSPLQAHPTINDELPYRVMTGAIRVKPNVYNFTQNAVHFDDGSVEVSIYLFHSLFKCFIRYYSYIEVLFVSVNINTLKKKICFLLNWLMIM